MITVEYKRFSALLLFQFRTVRNGISNKRRVCEERIVVIKALNPLDALSLAKERGKTEEFSYLDGDADILFEFIGVQELIELTSLEDDEVWWHLTEKVMPMESRKKLIPDESMLDALRQSSQHKRGRISVPGRSK